MLAQEEHKQRYDNIVYLKLIQKFRLVGEGNWYNYKTSNLVENNGAGALQSFNMQTDHVIKHRRPDIVVLYKTERKCDLIDIDMTGNNKTESKEQEKVHNSSI